MSNVAILHFFLWHFLAHFGLLGLFRCFVAKLICCNLRTFLGKIFFGSNHVCVKNVSFCMSGEKKSISPAG